MVRRACLSALKKDIVWSDCRWHDLLSGYCKVQSESFGRLKFSRFPDGDKQEASYGVKEGVFYSLASSQVHITYTRYHRSVHTEHRIAYGYIYTYRVRAKRDEARQTGYRKVTRDD